MKDWVTVLENLTVRSGAMLQERVADEFQSLRILLGLGPATETEDTKILTNRYVMDDVLNDNMKTSGKLGKVGELGTLKTFGAKVVQDKHEWDFTKVAFKMSHEAQLKIMAGQDVSMEALNQYVGAELIRMVINELTENIGRQVSLRKVPNLEGNTTKAVYSDYFRPDKTLNMPKKPEGSILDGNNKESWKTYESKWGDYLYNAFCEAIVRGDTEIQARQKRSRSFTDTGDVKSDNIPSKNLAIMPLGMLDTALFKHLQGNLIQTYHDRLFRYIENLNGYTCVFVPISGITIYKDSINVSHVSDKFILLLDSNAISTYYVDFGKGIPRATSTLERIGKPNLVTSWIEYQSGTEIMESDAFYRHFRWGITSYITDPSSVIFFDLMPNFQ